jgi:cholesterol transport system auxiliary component
MRNITLTFVTKGLCIIAFFLTACSPIKTPVSNQYKLDSYSKKQIAQKTRAYSILISQPDAMAGYQTEQMLYTNKPFALSTFANNAWITSPANMLYPLITQSLQKSHYFYAVASGPDVDKADYRLDTQLLALHQNFLVNPSRIELKMQAVLTHIADNRILASRIFEESIPCPANTPYGGVVAANRAASALTASLTHFVIWQISHDQVH